MNNNIDVEKTSDYLGNDRRISKMYGIKHI